MRFSSSFWMSGHTDLGSSVGAQLLTAGAVQWRGIALENYTVPAVFIPRHQHPEHFLHVVLSGAVKYEVNTRGRSIRFTSRPGTIFLLPRGTVDEVNWAGPTKRTAVAIHPRLLTDALDETAHETDIQLTEHWDLIDRHISALLLEMTADLDDGSPAGTIYRESLANALAVYLLKRYAVRRVTPLVFRGGLPGYRLKRVLDHIADNLDEDIRLSQLAEIAGMSPHYFSALFKRSTGRALHQYVLLQTIERAKQQTASRPQAQHHRRRTRRRISKSESFCACFSQGCRHHPFKFPSGYLPRTHCDNSIATT